MDYTVASRWYVTGLYSCPLYESASVEMKGGFDLPVGRN